MGKSKIAMSIVGVVLSAGLLVSPAYANTSSGNGGITEGYTSKNGQNPTNSSTSSSTNTSSATNASYTYPPCQGTFDGNQGVTDVTFQTNTTTIPRSVQWGFVFTPYGQSVVGPTVNVGITTARVNGNLINSPYPMRYDYPSDYNFHGSMTNYQYQGQSGGGSLQPGDVINFYWTVQGVYGDGWTDVICQVP